MDIVEELGDVLLQVVFQAQVGADRRAFSIDDVARGIADKLVRRHPHVFADGAASTAAEVQANWDRLKQDEKGRAGPFDGVPAALPGLVLLETLQRKAAKRGFRWDDLAGPVAKVREELAEVEAAAADGDRGHVAAEVGDLLGAVVALARQLQVDPDEAARAAARRFRTRFERVLREVAERRARPRGARPDDVARAVGACSAARQLRPRSGAVAASSAVTRLARASSVDPGGDRATREVPRVRQVPEAGARARPPRSAGPLPALRHRAHG